PSARVNMKRSPYCELKVQAADPTRRFPSCSSVRLPKAKPCSRHFGCGLRKSRHPATMRIALRRHAKRYRLGCARASFPPRHILDQESERNNLMNRRCFLRALAAAPVAGLAPIPLVFPWDAIAQSRGGGMAPADPFKPSDEANSPIGAGRGIHPGRVVWVRDAKATSWDGTTG